MDILSRRSDQGNSTMQISNLVMEKNQKGDTDVRKPYSLELQAVKTCPAAGRSRLLVVEDFLVLFSFQRSIFGAIHLTILCWLFVCFSALIMYDVGKQGGILGIPISAPSMISRAPEAPECIICALLSQDLFPQDLFPPKAKCSYHQRVGVGLEFGEFPMLPAKTAFVTLPFCWVVSC